MTYSKNKSYQSNSNSNANALPLMDKKVSSLSPKSNKKFTLSNL